MEIPFLQSSEFFQPIEEALRGASGELRERVRVLLRPGGYNQDVHVQVRPGDTATFWADWTSKQPSRFSMRLRAAATVLQKRGLSGRYFLSHRDGILIIQPE